MLLLICNSLLAQTSSNIFIQDSISVRDSTVVKQLKFNVKQLIIPAALIGFGVIGINSDQLKDLNAEKTLKDLQIVTLREKNEALREILKNRYEQIKILEKDFNELNESIKSSKNQKEKLIEQIEKLIHKIENLEDVFDI